MTGKLLRGMLVAAVIVAGAIVPARQGLAKDSNDCKHYGTTYDVDHVRADTDLNVDLGDGPFAGSPPYDAVVCWETYGGRRDVTPNVAIYGWLYYDTYMTVTEGCAKMAVSFSSTGSGNWSRKTWFSACGDVNSSTEIKTVWFGALRHVRIQLYRDFPDAPPQLVRTIKRKMMDGTSE